jgi:gamma-glutamyltranspeptidase/glutathione hydrolase
MIEAMKRAYRDRAAYLGDPGFVTNPTLPMEKAYAKSLARKIDLTHATPSAELAGDIRLSPEGEHTTHISVVDAGGMAVSLTTTLENLYGCRITVKGAGFLLNDEMNDFNWLPGITNASGRIGTAPNQIAPGKRMLSSMCPTIVVRNGKVLLVTGSPGGRTIINTVFCVVVNVLDFGMDIRAAVDAPRMHHQWFPDKVVIEAELAKDHPDLVRELPRLGHAVSTSTKTQGNADSIWIDPATREPIEAKDYRACRKVVNP